MSPRSSDRLPDFPWDRLAPFSQRANEHPDGVVDLSVGTPVDPTPAVIADALAVASNAPGYPTTVGTNALREACSSWLKRSLSVDVDTDAILPTIGSKEFIAWLPTVLGLDSSDTVVVPEVAYPTYAVGAAIAGCQIIATDATHAVGPAPVSLFWLNTPANPTGRVLGVEHLRKVVEWSRERDVLIVSDECYVELGWDVEPVSILHPDVSDGDHRGLLAVHSLSKRSNLAGYRFGFVAGDRDVVRSLTEVRKHAGMMVPTPVQAAATAAYSDDAHVHEQRDRYRRRRDVLRPALEAAGLVIEHSEAGLYFWATRDEPCWDTVSWFADRGIVVTPGDFYGGAGARHIRVALTATDERVDAAVARLTAA